MYHGAGTGSNPFLLAAACRQLAPLTSFFVAYIDADGSRRVPSWEDAPVTDERTGTCQSSLYPGSHGLLPPCLCVQQERQLPFPPTSYFATVGVGNLLLIMGHCLQPGRHHGLPHPLLHSSSCSADRVIPSLPSSHLQLLLPCLQGD